jgi:hypothetical protein
MLLLLEPVEVLFSLGDQALNLNALSQIRTKSQPGVILILLPLLGSFLVFTAHQTEVIEGLFGTLLLLLVKALKPLGCALWISTPFWCKLKSKVADQLLVLHTAPSKGSLIILALLILDLLEILSHGVIIGRVWKTSKKGWTGA